MAILIVIMGLLGMSVGALALMASIRKAKSQRASQEFEEAT